MGIEDDIFNDITGLSQQDYKEGQIKPLTECEMCNGNLHSGNKYYCRNNINSIEPPYIFICEDCWSSLPPQRQEEVIINTSNCSDQIVQWLLGLKNILEKEQDCFDLDTAIGNTVQYSCISPHTVQLAYTVEPWNNVEEVINELIRDEDANLN